MDIWQLPRLEESLEELTRELDADAERAFHGTHRCCAERRLLGSYVRQARKAGVPRHKQVAWVRRKLGSSVVVWRRKADGSLACAAPCLFCNRELQKFDLRVLCTLGDGQWFNGRLSEEGAPTPALTGGQKKVLRKQRWKLCQRKTLPEQAQQAQQAQQQQEEEGEPAPQQQQQQAQRAQRAGGQQQAAGRQQPALPAQQQRQAQQQQRQQQQPQGRRQRRRQRQA